MTEEDIKNTGDESRPEDYLRDGAWRHEEINSGFSAPVWQEKNPNGGFAGYPRRDQSRQLSCVPYSFAKALSVDELAENGVWRELSPRSVYPFVAVPGGGSSPIAAAKLLVKIGMTLETLLPTDGLSEDAARSTEGYASDAKQVALIYRPAGFVECSSDFETIASVIQHFRDHGTKKVVTVSMIGQNNGTALSQFPRPPSAPSGLWYHRVVVTDFGLIGGEKFLAIDNTLAGVAGQQFLGEDYEPLIYGAIYTLNGQDLATSGATRPSFRFETDFGMGSSGPQVTALQRGLQSVGMFPSSTVVAPTGNFGGITRRSVMLFQEAFGIESTGFVGPKTRERLNQLFGA